MLRVGELWMLSPASQVRPCPALVLCDLGPVLRAGELWMLSPASQVPSCPALVLCDLGAAAYPGYMLSFR